MTATAEGASPAAWEIDADGRLVVRAGAESRVVELLTRESRAIAPDNSTEGMTCESLLEAYRKAQADPAFFMGDLGKQILVILERIVEGDGNRWERS